MKYGFFLFDMEVKFCQKTTTEEAKNKDELGAAKTHVCFLVYDKCTMCGEFFVCEIINCMIKSERNIKTWYSGILGIGWIFL